jgi:hypothetical protein
MERSAPPMQASRWPRLRYPTKRTLTPVVGVLSAIRGDLLLQFRIYWSGFRQESGVGVASNKSCMATIACSAWSFD